MSAGGAVRFVENRDRDAQTDGRSVSALLEERQIASLPLCCVPKACMISGGTRTATEKKKLSCLVFITEENFGKPFLDAPMPRAYIKYLADRGLRVSIAYVRHR